MDEDLLGYLLAALEPHEMRRVAQRLEEDPGARQQMSQIERLLRRFEDGYQPAEPPPSDLVARTLANLPPLPSAELAATRRSQMAATSDSLIAMQDHVEPPGNATATWVDWAAGSVATAVLLALLLPTMAEGRFESRKNACQDQLRQFGTAITQFVLRSEHERLPAVSPSGPEAFAGVYAVRLHDAGLMDDPMIRWCPSLDPPMANEVQLTPINELVSAKQLHEASVDRLREIQRVSGGHYAFTLGVIDENRFAPPRYESRSSFAVMSDAPMAGIPDGDNLREMIGHFGRGINVLYEDGRVQFLSIPSLTSIPDHPLFNHRGQAEAGVNIDDASLAPSWRPPFINVRQR